MLSDSTAGSAPIVRTHKLTTVTPLLLLVIALISRVIPAASYVGISLTAQTTNAGSEADSIPATRLRLHLLSVAKRARTQPAADSLLLLIAMNPVHIHALHRRPLHRLPQGCTAIRTPAPRRNRPVPGGAARREGPVEGALQALRGLHLLMVLGLHPLVAADGLLSLLLIEGALRAVHRVLLQIARGRRRIHALCAEGATATDATHGVHGVHPDGLRALLRGETAGAAEGGRPVGRALLMLLVLVVLLLLLLLLGPSEWAHERTTRVAAWLLHPEGDAQAPSTAHGRAARGHACRRRRRGEGRRVEAVA